MLVSSEKHNYMIPISELKILKLKENVTCLEVHDQKQQSQDSKSHHPHPDFLTCNNGLLVVFSYLLFIEFFT